MRERFADCWPILERAAIPPKNWPGWPNGKKFAFILTHDVETQIGQRQCLALANLEERHGFRSSFNFPPERYKVSRTLRHELEKRGFEIGIHGLNHDGKLFTSRRLFQERAKKINRYLAEWGCVGFRAPAMHHNLDWIGDLDIVYDSSTFDTDPFEPQPDGMGTIFPFLVPRKGDRPAYCELPYTLPQDMTVMVLMAGEGLQVWKRKLDWIAENGGMALLNSHPDYMCLEGTPSASEYPIGLYEEFLLYAKKKYKEQCWAVLPREVASFCLENSSRLCLDRPKRVCMVAYTFYESDGRVMRYAEALANRGDDVEVLALDSPESENPKEERIRGVQLFRIQNRSLDEKGPLSYLIKLLRFLARSSKIAWKRKSWRCYDLLHVHNVPDFLVFAAWRHKITGSKVILDIHDIVPEFYKDKFGAADSSVAIRLLLFMEKLCCRFSDHVIVSNHLWMEKLSGRSVSADKCSTYLNYPDPGVFSTELECVKEQDRFVLSYPGTLAVHQGLDVAIRAVSKLADKIPGLVFQIYGSGPQEQELRELTRELGLDELVQFRPGVPLREIPRVIGGADLGIVAKQKNSFGNEAFSTKILEFMFLGVPVIAADTRIDKYYFNDSVVKFFRSGDEEDLAETIYALWKDPSEREALTTNALKFVQEYSWARRMEDYYALVDSLIAGTPGHTGSCIPPTSSKQNLQ